jgi:predicted glycoside hydrolase/deacetylase ChbG (UPF0249 family)
MLSIKKRPANSGGNAKETLRAVIFNADDFGLNSSANAGIRTCHEKGVVLSTSLMSTGEAFDEAVDYASRTPSLDTGLHLALCETRPVSDPCEIPSLISDGGLFAPNFAAFLKLYLCGAIQLHEVEREFRAQVKKALDTGLRITHLDSHQHLHALPSILEIVIRLAVENKIPSVRCPDERRAPVMAALREGRVGRAMQRFALSTASRLGRRSIACSRVATTDHFLGFMEMGRWKECSLRAGIQSLPPGLAEICCHPRQEPEPSAGSDFPGEITALTSDGLKLFLEKSKVQVTSFREYFTLRSQAGA